MSSKLNKSEIIPGSFLSKFELKKRLNFLGIEPFIPNDNTFYLSEKSILINQYDNAIKDEQNYEKIKELIEKDKNIEIKNLNNKRFLTKSNSNKKNNKNNNDFIQKQLPNKSFNNFNQQLCLYDENINSNNINNNSNNKNNDSYFSFNFNDFPKSQENLSKNIKNNTNNLNHNKNIYNSLNVSPNKNNLNIKPEKKFPLKELILIPFVGCVSGSIYLFSQYGNKTEIANLINRIDLNLIKKTFYKLFNISKNYTKIFTKKFFDNFDIYFKMICSGINQILDNGILYNINLLIFFFSVMYVFWHFLKFVFQKKINNKTQLN
jgi:hypothetical protein